MSGVLNSAVKVGKLLVACSAVGETLQGKLRRLKKRTKYTIMFMLVRTAFVIATFDTAAHLVRNALKTSSIRLNGKFEVGILEVGVAFLFNTLIRIQVSNSLLLSTLPAPSST